VQIESKLNSTSKNRESTQELLIIWKRGELMDKARKEFLERLNLKREEFEQALRQLKQNQKEYSEEFSGGNIKDEFDHAQLEISLNNNYGLIERKTRELREIDRQIRKILRDEKFGGCEECGQPIPLERLLIVPEASLCIKCQKKLEKLDYSKNLSSRSYSRFDRLGEKEWQYSDELDDLEIDPMDSEVDFSFQIEEEESEVN
jgi:DnaK suppressor protein